MQNDSPWTFDNGYVTQWYYHPLGNLGTKAVITEAVAGAYVVWHVPHYQDYGDCVFKTLLDAKIYAIATCAELDQKRLDMEMM